MLGSCSVPLDDSMQLICNDVENLGLSVPSVHGEKGDFTIFNMMGSEIGKVKLGFRLLSLGVGLMPHIPDNAVVKFKEKTISLDECKEASKAKDTANIVLHDIQAADKPVQVDIWTPGPTMEQILQTENGQLQTTATQTSKEKQRKNKFRNKSSNLVDDIFVTNTVCPPPLYYNSEAEPKKPIKPGLTFADGDFEYNPTRNTQEYYVNGATATGEVFPRYNHAFEDDEDKYSEYSESTIRHEDRFSDSDVEEVVDFGASKITSQRKPLRKTLLKSTPEESRSQLVSRTKSFHTPNVLGNVMQFPLINALLSEIVNLQGMGPQVSQIITQDTASQVQQKSPRIRSAWEDSGSPKSTRRHETREDFLSRIATPRGEHEHEGDPGYHKGKRSCASPQKVVPRNKSWLRKEPEKMQTVHGVKKTKLSYGMTNTQRLRLAKGNPELLKTLEKKEELRLHERKKKQQAVKSGPSVKPSAKQRVEVGAEAASRSKFSLQLESSSRDTMESPKQHKRPVPTPRLSLTGDKKDQKTREYFAAEKERLLKQMAQRSHNPSEENESSAYSYHTAEPQQSDRSEKSIDVYLPSVDQPAFDANSEDALSVEGSDFGKGTKSALGQTKTLAGPGFPRESVESRLSMVSSYSAIYSDDFEEEKYGNSYDERALRKVIEQYSESSAESGQEPSLRKVVEQYSDEGNEPSLRKVVDKYSDDDTLSGKEPSLRKLVDQYSEDNASNKTDTKSNGSYHSPRSAKNKGSTPPEVIPQSDIKIKDLPMPNPTSSLRSPTPHNKLGASVSTREAMAASTPVEEESETDLESSTARIPRSQMPSQSFETGTSLDSTGEAAWKRRRQPRPSPRRSLERIRTESVSSYNPSDPENLSPVSPGEPEDLFSETYEDNSKSAKEQYKYAKDIKVPASAKGLGYTWT